MYGDYSNNTSTANLNRGSDLANIEQRYLLEKYFNNEATFSITTIAPQALTLTATPASGDTSATLTSAWTFVTTTGLATFSSGDLREVSLVNGSTAISWNAGLSAAATTAVSVNVQTYPLPADYSKLKTGTLTIGNLKWTPLPIFNRQDWDQLNVFPYLADIPSRYFIWDNTFKIWPIPSTTGNVITFNYKRRVPDLSIADYTTPGSITVTNGSTTVTGSGTSFALTNNLVAETRYLQVATPDGDELWYPIAKVTSTTALTLSAPYQGNTVTSSTYTIGQMPALQEDFQDMLVWKPLMIYFSTIQKDEGKFKQFEGLYMEKLKMLDDYLGSKTINVNLSRRPSAPNPNLFYQI